MNVELTGDGPCPIKAGVLGNETRRQVKSMKKTEFLTPDPEEGVPGTVFNLYKHIRNLLPPQWNELPEPWQWRYLCVHCSLRRSPTHYDWKTCPGVCWQCNGTNHCGRAVDENGKVVVDNYPCPSSAKLGEYYTRHIGRQELDEFCDPEKPMFQPRDWRVLVDGVARLRIHDILDLDTAKKDVPTVGSHLIRLFHSERETNRRLRAKLEEEEEQSERYREEARHLREEVRTLREELMVEQNLRLKSEVAQMRSSRSVLAASPTAIRSSKRERSPHDSVQSQNELFPNKKRQFSPKGCFAEENAHEIEHMAALY